MAFQYAHHRPMTPITPIHSPHPSAGSSIRARTPGQLSLHEYRKMQVTPSPPAIPGQKTVKKKRGLSSLSRSENLPARTPSENYYSSFQSMTTPPETPSLSPPVGFTSNMLPVDRTTVSRVAPAPAEPTYPEFEHLLASGSEFAHSPPYSPPVPALSSASRQPQSTSPFQPPTPRYSADPRVSPQSSEKHPLLSGEHVVRSRPWTQNVDQDRRYVDQLSTIARPWSAQQVKYVDVSGRATSSGADFEQSLRPRSTVGSERQSWDPTSWLRNRPATVGSYRYSELPDQSRGQRISKDPHIDVHPSLVLRGNSNFFASHAGTGSGRERHFNPIKRLPRPESSAKRRPAPLRLAISNTDGLYSSDHNTASTSTFSLSKYPFPQPPQTPRDFLESQIFSTSTPKATLQDSQHLSAKSPSVRFSGISFEIVNPRQSSGSIRPLTSSSESNYQPQSASSSKPESSTIADMSDDRSGQPPRARHYDTYEASHENITRPAGSRSFTDPLAGTPPAAQSPDWTFDEHGNRRSPDGRQLTPSIQAGPGASQSQLRQISQGSAPPFARALNYTQPQSVSSLPRSSESLLPSTSADATRAEPPLHGPVGPEVRHQEADPRNVLTSILPADVGSSARHPEAWPLRHNMQPSVGSFGVPGRVSNEDGAVSPVSAPRRSTYYGSSTDSGHLRLPAADPTFTNGHRISAVSSTSEYPDEGSSSLRRSNPFDYESYINPASRGDSTLSHIIGTYGNPNARESRYTGNFNPFHDPPREEDEYDYDFTETPAAPVEEPAPAVQARTFNGLPDNNAPRTEPTAEPSNGSVRGDVAGQGQRIPLWQRYGLQPDDSLRDIPIAELETMDDFEEIVSDMWNQPIMAEVDERYNARYLAIMLRAGHLFGAEQRRRWEGELAHIFVRRAPTESNGNGDTTTGASRAATSNGASQQGQTHRMTTSFGALGNLSHPSRTMTSSSSQSFGIQQREARRRQDDPIHYTGPPFMPYTIEDIEDYNDAFSGQDPVSASSPLDPSPHPVNLTGQSVFDSSPYRLDRPAADNAADLAQAYIDARRDHLSTRFGPEGPSGRPPLQPAPAPADALASNVRPPFAVEQPESSNISGSVDTRQLLNPRSPPTVAVDSTTTSSHPAVGSQTGTNDPLSALRALQTDIPDIWAVPNARSSGSYRGGSSRRSVAHAQSASQASAANSTGVNDQDEWVTEPSTSKHNSGVPYPPPPPGEDRRWSGILPFSHGRPAPLQRPHDSNHPGFYPREELSNEPHDEYIDVGSPPSAITPAGVPYEDIEMQPYPKASRRSAMRTPGRVKHRQRSNDTSVTIFAPNENVRSPRNNPSVRSARAGRARSFVASQDSTIPFLLNADRSRASATKPAIRRLPHEMTRGQKLAADIIKYSCTTWLAPLCLPPFLLGVGVLDFFVRDRASKKMKRFALAEALFFFMVVVIAATVGITLSVRDERRSNGEGY